jgi:hypothetical protein
VNAFTVSRGSKNRLIDYAVPGNFRVFPKGTAAMQDTTFLRRSKASAYLLEKYGFGAERTLAKGVVTGDTPEFHKAGRIVLYTREALDRWALGKIREPVRSTSERPPQGTAPGKRGRPAGAKPISATLDRVEAAEAKREAV